MAEAETVDDHYLRDPQGALRQHLESLPEARYTWGTSQHVVRLTRRAATAILKALDDKDNEINMLEAELDYLLNEAQ